MHGPSTKDASLSITGNGPNGRTQCSIDYAALGMTPIGVSGISGSYGASTTYAQLCGKRSKLNRISISTSNAPVLVILWQRLNAGRCTMGYPVATLLGYHQRAIPKIVWK